MKKEMVLKGKIGPLYARFCSASVLGMIGISLYILADTFFIANGIGKEALAALNIVLPVYSLIMAYGLLIGIGAATCYSVEVGKGDSRAANSYYKAGVAAGIAGGVIFMILGLTIPDRISYMMGASQETIGYCTEYLRVIMSFAPAFILNNIFLAFVRNIDKPNIAMVSMIAGSLFNIVFDYLTVYVWGMGMFGAAAATAVSPLVGMAISLPFLLSKKSGLSFKGVKIKAKQVPRVLSGGASSFIVELSSGIVVFILNTIMLRLSGNLGVAAYGIIANVTIVASCIFTGMGQALQPIASINYGAGKTTRIKKAFFVAVITALVAGILLYIFGTRFAKEITAVFNGSGDPQLAALTEKGISIYFLAYIPMGVNMVLSYFFQSVLDIKRSLVISLLRGLALISAGALILSALFGIDGIWMAAPFAEICTVVYCLIACVTWFKKVKKADKEFSPESVVSRQTT